ncbi:hypothetical protein LC653_38410 [Nostoc sp. CHAB 5784]|uniref:hypothetical protein n=1 Tax=Nostoc mirabile TaxID=2907820 RepID=UPI001E30E20D|nr:hypothetical protein [Nostoc mirabile]MCC5669541.1 hypothetical protein [Nostoc mirabile CHAB5784]
MFCVGVKSPLQNKIYELRITNYELFNIDFPIWMIKALEHEAKRLGVTSDSIIKLWLAERLDKIITD